VPVERLLADISNISLQDNSEPTSPLMEIVPSAVESRTVARGIDAAAQPDIISQSPAPEVRMRSAVDILGCSPTACMFA
jgi:hypothetical protein